jgi:hypothetical protein
VDRWELGAIAIAAVYCVVLGVVLRTGHFRRGLLNTYFNRELPGYQRNAPFAFVPGGLAFLLIGAGTILQSRLQPSDTDPLATTLLVLGVVCLVTFFWWLFRPPRWIKPAWVRDYERAEATGEPVPDLRPPPMSQRAYVLNWIGLVAGAAVWLVVGLPLGPLLIGLGFGLSLLVANRPRSA